MLLLSSPPVFLFCFEKICSFGHKQAAKINRRLFLMKAYLKGELDYSALYYYFAGEIRNQYNHSNVNRMLYNALSPILMVTGIENYHSKYKSVNLKFNSYTHHYSKWNAIVYLLPRYCNCILSINNRSLLNIISNWRMTFYFTAHKVKYCKRVEKLNLSEVALGY